MKRTTRQRIKTCVRFIIFGVAVIVFSASVTTAQITPSTPRPPLPPPSDPPGSDKNETTLGNFEEEMRAKRAIKLAEKDHQENLGRARELSQLAKTLQSALKDKNTIDRDSLKKLERLEKMAKKIRNKAGGEDEEVNIVDRPTDITSAINQIAESAEALSKNVQDTPRQVVSASLIGNANVLLELIRLLRAFDPRQ
ncbi:MAG TPA: hypothetical protein VFT02_04515 [Pyrinomonadaceae bacterium]|nr:hypothetical protein [Pyrinomonadaceae bacterium]